MCYCICPEAARPEASSSSSRSRLVALIKITGRLELEWLFGFRFFRFSIEFNVANLGGTVSWRRRRRTRNRTPAHIEHRTTRISGTRARSRRAISPSRQPHGQPIIWTNPGQSAGRRKRSSAHYGSEEREREQKNIPRSNMHPGRRLRAERARLKGFLRAATALLRWAITSAPCCLAPALALARLPPAFASCRLEGRR